MFKCVTVRQLQRLCRESDEAFSPAWPSNFHSHTHFTPKKSPHSPSVSARSQGAFWSTPYAVFTSFANRFHLKSLVTERYTCCLTEFMENRLFECTFPPHIGYSSSLWQNSRLRQHKEGRVCLGSQFKNIVHHGGERKAAGTWSIGQIISTDRKQRAKNPRFTSLLALYAVWDSSPWNGGLYLRSGSSYLSWPNLGTLPWACPELT